MRLLAIYLLAINLFAFLLYGVDKRKAKKSEYRISERTLLLVAAVGGSVGAILAMRCFKHKTRHRKFYIGLPIMLMAQTVLLVCAISMCETKGFSIFAF